MSAPGLKVAVPSNPADALGLLKIAIRDDNPVVFLEHKAQYSDRADVPDGEHLIPFGLANVVRAGRDVTIVAVQRMVAVALSAAEGLAGEGISCEIIDPRTLVPLDMDTILRSVEKTTRLITVEEAPRRGGWGAEIVSRVADEGIWRLDAPIRRVTMGDALIPFSPPLETHVTPSAEQVVRAVREMLNR
jgi:pyruvate dehydrogenase E1 component beta subunit